MTTLTRAQRADLLTELRELLPTTRDSARNAQAIANRTRNPASGTGHEPAAMRTAREQIADAYDDLGNRYTAYANATLKALTDLEGNN